MIYRYFRKDKHKRRDSHSSDSDSGDDRKEKSSKSTLVRLHMSVAVALVALSPHNVKNSPFFLLSVVLGIVFTHNTELLIFQ